MISVIAFPASLLLLPLAAIMYFRFLQGNDGVSSMLLREKKINKGEIEQAKSLSIDNLEAISKINAEKLQDFISSSEERVVESATKSVQRNLRETYEEAVNADRIEGAVLGHFKNTSDRLKKEVVDLARRGNSNLVIGTALALTGVLLLGYFATSPNSFVGASVESETDLTSRQIMVEVIKFGARLGLVIIIEVFAYFFLRLYKASLDDIKYFQNEITNIEAREIALSAGFATFDQEQISRVVEILGNTERNFVLKKGETTADIEKTRLENSHWEALAKTAGTTGASFFRKAGAEKKPK